MTDRTIVVIGDVMTDVIARLAEPLAVGSDATAAITTAGGGSGANVAAWLAHAGHDVIFVGRVGNDDDGHVRIDELRRGGVTADVGVDDTAPTGTTVVIVTPDGQRTMLPGRGANLRLTAADLPGQRFVAGAHLHLSGYALFDDGPRSAGLQALTQARRAGMTISIDPSSAQPLAAVGPATFLGWTSPADLCLPNLDEAQVLTGIADAEGAARALASYYAEVVVTLGGEGAVWTDGTDVTTLPAVTAPVVDTTGAGDAFTAGYLAALRDGQPVVDRLRSGAELAALAVSSAGARPPGRAPG